MTAPVGFLSLARANFRRTIADCAIFRTWTETDTHAKAMARIHDERPPTDPRGDSYTLQELQQMRPCVVVWGGPIDTEKSGGTTGFDKLGSFVARFEQDVEPEIKTNHSEIAIRWENFIGALIEQILAKSGGEGDDGTYISVDDKLTMPEPWGRSTREERHIHGDVLLMQLEVSYNSV